MIRIIDFEWDGNGSINLLSAEEPDCGYWIPARDCCTDRGLIEWKETLTRESWWSKDLNKRLQREVTKAREHFRVTEPYLFFKGSLANER